jgi:hypothetical protein
MSERAKEFYERDSVPTITTAHPTPTARSLTVAPMSTSTMITHRDRPWMNSPCYSHIEIGDGTLTAQSRAEVARITRRLGGRLKP